MILKKNRSHHHDPWSSPWLLPSLHYHRPCCCPALPYSLLLARIPLALGDLTELSSVCPCARRVGKLQLHRPLSSLLAPSGKHNIRRKAAACSHQHHPVCQSLQWAHLSDLESHKPLGRQTSLHQPSSRSFPTETWPLSASHVSPLPTAPSSPQGAGLFCSESNQSVQHSDHLAHLRTKRVLLRPVNPAVAPRCYSVFKLVLTPFKSKRQLLGVTVIVIPPVEKHGCP